MSSDVLATSVSTLSALNAAIAAADQATTAGSYEIDLAAGANIELTGALNAINLHAGVTLDIEGEGATLNGANAQGVSDHQRGLFVYAGTVTIESLTIANAEAVGGSSGSGGGGAGLGGGLFVANDVVHGAASAGAVTLTNVNFSGDSAKGGSSGVSVLGGGGGGLGGDGYSGGGGVERAPTAPRTEARAPEMGLCSAPRRLKSWAGAGPGAGASVGSLM